MKKLLTFFIIILFSSANLNAQLFQNVIGKVNGSESAISVTQSADSSYLLAGSFYPLGADKSQEFIAHLNKNGSLDWTRKIGVTGLSNAFWLISSQAEAVKKRNGNPDGYIMLIDETETISQDPDCYLVRLNNSGGIIWARHITFVSGKKVRPSYDASGSLTGFIILGQANAGAVILKTTITGEQLWQKRIASNVANGQYRLEDLQATADGGCIAAGSLLVNFDVSQPALFKMNNAGDRRSRGLPARRGSRGGAAAVVRPPFRTDRRGRNHRADVAPWVARDARAHWPSAGRLACGARPGAARDRRSRAPARRHRRSVGHSTWRRGDGRAGREVE